CSPRNIRGIDQDGADIYGRFRTVFHLANRPASADPAWDTVLKNVRAGACTAEDIALLRSLILNPSHAADFISSPWRQATLITSRNAVVEAWNALATLRHSFEQDEIIYICPALDVARGRQGFRDGDTALLAGLKAIQAGRLASQLEIAVGLKMSTNIN
ncbi:hypothetical protein C8R44DRAFT_570579, partial [Mycena epipterygia]